MPLDQQDIFNKAVQNMQGFKIEKTPDSAKRSLFGVLNAVIDSVEHIDAPKNDTLKYHRIVLKRLSDMHKFRIRFMGVKLDDLKNVITTMFSEGEEILPKIEFGMYKHQDIKSYIEICRRIFMTDRTYDVAVVEKQITKHINIVENKWSFDGVNKLAIYKALTLEDADCAQFVLDHPRDKGNTKELLKQAADIVKKRQV